MSETARVLLTDHPWPETDIEQRLYDAAGLELVVAPAEDEETLAQRATDVVAITTCWAKVTGRVIAAAHNCRHVARLGIGLDNIDVVAATQRGMVVTNVPDYCVDEVADHAMALLLNAARHITFFDRQRWQGVYNLAAAPPMPRLSEKTLGIVGFGHTGQGVWERALGFGLAVIAHSKSGNDHGTGCEMVQFEDLLAQSDFISLHTPLTEATYHLIDAEAIRLMKPNAYLINTSRGAVVDDIALWEAIQSGKLAGAALDVQTVEPPDLAHPMYQDPRITITPHAAFVSESALRDLRERVCQQVIDVHQGRQPEHVVNQ